MRSLLFTTVKEIPKITETTAPKSTPGSAKIRIHAAGWNRRDHWIIQGKYPDISTPVILGSDGCGLVEECDDQPDLIGQEIIICPSFNWMDDPFHQDADFHILGMPQNGTMCDEIVVPIENVFRKPNHLQAEEAAALPLAGLTAWRAISTRANLQKNETVLITGIGGSTAIFALQFAVAMGAEVYVTSSSTQKIDKAKQLGAKGGVLYTDSNWGKQLENANPQGFDVIIDSAGGEGFGTLVKLLGMGGRLVFFGGTKGKWPEILPQYLFFKQVSLLASTMGSIQEFQEMIRFVTSHKIRPIIDSIYELDEYQNSLQRIVHPDRFGKVIVQFD